MEEEDLGHRFGITGFPTLKYFPAGDEVEAGEYSEGRDLDSFVKFLNKKASPTLWTAEEAECCPARCSHPTTVVIQNY